LNNETQETLPNEENLLIHEERGVAPFTRSANDTENEKDAYRMPSQVSRDRTGLLNIKDDDPSLHPPVAALPRQQDDEDDEKEAYRLPSLTRQTSPVSSRRLVNATAGNNESNESPQEPEFHRQANLDPRPGAIPMNGRAAGQAPDWARPQPESPPRQPIRQHQGRVLSDFNLRFYRTNSSSIQNADITEANAIDDAEAVVYATSVNPDRTAKNRRIAVGLGILAVAIIVGLSVGLVSTNVSIESKDNGLDPWCLLPLNEQDVFARCVCNTTKEILLEDKETQFYDVLQKLLRNESVITNYYTINSCEPQNQCMLWESNYIRRNISDEIAQLMLDENEPAIQAYILCMVYLQFDGRNWQQNQNWLNETVVCNWFGVSCSFLSRITRIELPANGLNGSFPTELSYMPFLRELVLSRNPDMVGTIPSELSKANALRILDLSHASMTGTIPKEIEHFEIIERLVLSNNSFSGTIPLSIGRLQKLRQLYIDGNHFIGSVPSELGNLSRLVELSLSHNALNGTLDTELSRLTNLEVLRVNNNDFTSPLPFGRHNQSNMEWNERWRFLEEINLSNNNFTGPFPLFLGELRYLVSTFVHNTQLTGSIPQSFCEPDKCSSCHYSGL
jgi:hypothetical protein